MSYIRLIFIIASLLMLGACSSSSGSGTSSSVSGISTTSQVSAVTAK